LVLLHNIISFIWFYSIINNNIKNLPLEALDFALLIFNSKSILFKSTSVTIYGANLYVLLYLSFREATTFDLTWDFVESLSSVGVCSELSWENISFMFIFIGLWFFCLESDWFDFVVFDIGCFNIFVPLNIALLLSLLIISIVSSFFVSFLFDVGDSDTGEDGDDTLLYEFFLDANKIDDEDRVDDVDVDDSDDGDGVGSEVLLYESFTDFAIGDDIFSNMNFLNTKINMN